MDTERIWKQGQKKENKDINKEQEIDKGGQREA
jgi:hypothetical protein